MRKMKKIPVGIENFPEMRRQDFYYIDKTEMIRDLLYSWGQVNLFTRPRRFGKSLNMLFHLNIKSVIYFFIIKKRSF